MGPRGESSIESRAPSPLLTPKNRFSDIREFLEHKGPTSNLFEDLVGRTMKQGSDPSVVATEDRSLMTQVLRYVTLD